MLKMFSGFNNNYGGGLSIVILRLYVIWDRITVIMGFLNFVIS